MQQLIQSFQLSELLILVLFLLGDQLSLFQEVEGKEEYPFFNHIGLCLVKTFSMFVGELGESA
jgi:hypothetical protein